MLDKKDLFLLRSFQLFIYFNSARIVLIKRNSLGTIYTSHSSILVHPIFLTSSWNNFLFIQFHPSIISSFLDLIIFPANFQTHATLLRGVYHVRKFNFNSKIVN